MKRLQVLSVILLTVSFAYTVIAQESGEIKEGFAFSFPEKIQKLVLDPLPAGTYSVGIGGDFPTIDSAFNKLSIDGIAGEVIIELIDDVYTAPSAQYGFVLNGPIPGAGPNSRVTIKPAANHNVTIQGNNLGLLILINTSYVTFDGVGVTGSTTLTINALQNASYVYNDALDFNNNSDHNIIQNITFIVDDYLRPSAGIWFSGSAPDSNLIQYNAVKKAGIFLSITTGGDGNIIRGNQIGSETDSLVAYGIEIVDCEGTLIENNLIQNMKVTVSGSNQAQVGIALDGGNNQIIRNNVVRNCQSISGYVTAGIYAGVGGTNNQVYNNMVYGIHSTSIQSNSRLAGIYIAYQTNPKIYYNSVYLLGSGATPLGSAALYIYTSSTNVDAKNNIFINTRDESPYCASAIYDYTGVNITSDYNDLYYDNSNPNNCLVRIGTTKYNTLTNWQATLNDLNSYVEMPNFVEPYLHIDEVIPTYLESRGTPIAGITTDFDGDTRNALTPDIGADEFTSTVFALLVNVNDGWNMVSVPGLNSPDQNVNTWWAFRDMGTNVFKYSGGYQPITAAVPGTGYWMKHSGARIYNTGDEWPAAGIQIVSHDPIQGASGWNLIGGYEIVATAANVTTNPPGLQQGSIFKYSGGYQVATTLDPGYGYWIKLSAAGQIIIPEGLAKGEVEYFAEDWGRIILTDAAGRSYTLYAVKGEVNLDQYELPPAPPAEMFDIRFNSGRITEDLSNPQAIEMSGVVYPLKVKVENMDIRLQDESGKILNVNMKNGENVVIDNSTITKLMVSGELIPLTYSLSQNYPNPFNPSTKIQYSIQEKQFVTMVIYDILGSKVVTLVNEEKTTGKYEIEFDGITLPSGVYFYQIKAGSFIDTKKMILLK